MEIECPHCKQKLWIEEINCGIFRCGVLKENGQQIPPHASKEECNIYIQKGIYGCGNPFQIVNNIIFICDYI